MKHKFHEHVGRSIVKAITFRLLVLLFDGMIIFALTRRYDVTLGVVLLFNVIHMVVYFGHERLWNSVHWGKKR